MIGKYKKPSELLDEQKRTGKSYWDLIGRPLYEQPESDSQPANEQSKYALALQLREALSDYDYPQYKKGKGGQSYTYKPTGKYAHIQEYIHALENPNNMGFDGKVWRPVRMKGFDPYGINGLDIRQEHNPDVYNYLKSKGRLNDPYLTVEEEQMLQNKAISGVVSDTQRLLKKWGVKNYTDDDFTKAVGMRYHGTLRKDTVAPYVKNGVWDSEGSFHYGERKFTTRRSAHNKYWEQFQKNQPAATKQQEVPQVSETIQRAQSGYQFPESQIFQQNQRIAPPVGREPVTPYYLRPHEDNTFQRMVDSIKINAPNPMEMFQSVYGYNRGKSFPFNFWNRNHNVLKPVIRY